MGTLTRTLKMRLLNILSSVEVHVPTSNEQKDQVTPDVCSQNAEVPPSLVEFDAQRLIELVTKAVSAVGTVRTLVVDQIARATCGEKR